MVRNRSLASLHTVPAQSEPRGSGVERKSKAQNHITTSSPIPSQLLRLLSFSAALEIQCDCPLLALAMATKRLGSFSSPLNRCLRNAATRAAGPAATTTTVLPTHGAASMATIASFKIPKISNEPNVSFSSDRPIGVPPAPMLTLAAAPLREGIRAARRSHGCAGRLSAEGADRGTDCRGRQEGAWQWEEGWMIRVR